MSNKRFFMAHIYQALGHRSLMPSLLFPKSADELLEQLSYGAKN